MSDDIQGAPPAPEMPPAPPMAGGDRPGPESDTSKILAAIGYLIGVVALIAILIEPYKNEKFVKFHAVQALGMWVASIALGFIANIPIIGWIVAVVGGLAIFVVAIIAAIKAFQGEYYEVPVVYGIVKQYM